MPQISDEQVVNIQSKEIEARDLWIEIMKRDYMQDMERPCTSQKVDKIVIDCEEFPIIRYPCPLWKECQGQLQYYGGHCKIETCPHVGKSLLRMVLVHHTYPLRGMLMELSIDNELGEDVRKIQREALMKSSHTMRKGINEKDNL